MNEQQRYSLSNRDRLKSRTTIEYLFKAGKSLSNFPLKIYWLITEESKPKLKAAFGVSARHFKRAVDRNRVKRLMRESYRLQKFLLEELVHTKQQNLALFFIYTGKDLPEYQLIFDKTGQVIKRLIREINEKNLADI